MYALNIDVTGTSPEGPSPSMIAQFSSPEPPYVINRTYLMSVKIHTRDRWGSSEVRFKASNSYPLSSHGRAKGDEGTEGGREMYATGEGLLRAVRWAHMQWEIGI